MLLTYCLPTPGHHDTNDREDNQRTDDVERVDDEFFELGITDLCILTHDDILLGVDEKKQLKF